MDVSLSSTDPMNPFLSEQGFVDVFTTAGAPVRTLANGSYHSTVPDYPDQPWGVALAPANFGNWSNMLLVGNVFDGTINVFNPTTGDFLEQLQTETGSPIVLPGLQALTFGNGGGATSAGGANDLFFTSAPSGAGSGLFGSLTVGTAAVVQELGSLNVVPRAIQGFQPNTSTKFLLATLFDPHSPPSDFQALIDWGDGTALTPGTITEQAGGVLAISGTHTYTATTSFPPPFRVIIRDGIGPSVVVGNPANPYTAPIRTIPLTLQAEAGVPLPLGTLVARFFDENPLATAQQFQALIDWGDGTATTTGTIVQNGSLYDILGGHTYVQAGLFTVTVTVNNADGTPITILSSVNVLPGNPIQISPIPSPLTVTQGQRFVGAVATFKDSDGGKLASAFTVQINWGDGTSSAGSVVGVGSLATFHFEVLGSHQFARAGTFEITVLVHDKDGDVASNAAFTQTNLVTDPDSNLIDAWGMAVSSSGSFWVADNATGEVTLYDAAGTPQMPPITIPIPPSSTAATATPTGIVFNSTSAFALGPNGSDGAATFIVATEEGALAAWNSSLATAELVANNSGVGAVYTGLATGSVGGKNYLYAADFHNGVIDVFNTKFNQVTLAGTFTDPLLPPPLAGVPGYAPFNVQNIGGELYVTYALQDAVQRGDQPGVGNGFVDVFSTSGKFLKRLASGGALNSPWGLALAPPTFAAFSNALLVGNFGDGQIAAYNPTNGQFLGELADLSGTPLTMRPSTTSFSRPAPTIRRMGFWAFSLSIRPTPRRPP
jgi:uncharacterized protein (TIGR03118 family)